MHPNYVPNIPKQHNVVVVTGETTMQKYTKITDWQK